MEAWAVWWALRVRLAGGLLSGRAAPKLVFTFRAERKAAEPSKHGHLRVVNGVLWFPGCQTSLAPGSLEP